MYPQNFYGQKSCVKKQKSTEFLIELLEFWNYKGRFRFMSQS